MRQIKNVAPGILFCFMAALPAWFLGNALPVVGSPVFGIMTGMLIIMIFPGLLSGVNNSNTAKLPSIRCRLEVGVKFTSKKVLQYSIILLGFSMNLFRVLDVGRQSLYVIIFTISSSFLTAYIIGKALKIQGKTAALIGIGTSICGGSAIAAAAPVIDAKEEDVAQAISTIFLFNLIAVFIFPALGAGMGMSDTGFGMWAGTAINDTSSVVAAGTAWSNAAGNNDALSFATIVKLTRTLMIVPVTLVLAIYTAGKTKNSRTGDNVSFSFVKVFPWFVIGFVTAAVINTFWSIPGISAPLVKAGKFMIVMAMVSIGLNTNFKKLITNGFKPILLGICCWFAVATVSLAVQQVLGIW